MKTYLLTFLLLLCMFSCKEKEDPKPVMPNPFTGAWSYSSVSLGLKVSFTAFEQQGEIKFTNVKIEYSEVPKGQILDNTEGEAFDKFEDNDGFGMIKLSAANDLTWVSLNLIYNTTYQVLGKTAMNVHELRIDMINRNTIVLEDQVFYKQ